MTIETSDIISSIAALIAFGSLLISFLGLRNSRKALRLSEEEHSERKLPVKAYLIDAYSYQKEKQRHCIFAISFTNQSSSSKSFSLLELEIEYFDSKGVHGKALVPPIHEERPLGLSIEYKQLVTPLNLMPGETVSGWIAFALPEKDSTFNRIDSYRVVGRSSDGQESSAAAYLLKSMDYHEKT